MRPERLQPVGVAPLDGAPVVLGEAVGPGQQARGGHAQQAPQVHEGVLQRGARDGHGRRRAQAPHRLVGRRGVVLDELGLVEHEPGQVDGDQLVLVQARDGVAGHQHVRLRGLLGEAGAALGGGAGHGPHAQVGAEAPGLLHPGADDARGGDDEHRPGPRGAGGVARARSRVGRADDGGRVARGGTGQFRPGRGGRVAGVARGVGLVRPGRGGGPDQCDRLRPVRDRPRRGPPLLEHALDGGQDLDGLAQPHVVGQDAAQPGRAQQVQPLVALQLVGAQGRVQPGRRGDLQRVRARPAGAVAPVVERPQGQ